VRMGASHSHRHGEIIGWGSRGHRQPTNLSLEMSLMKRTICFALASSVACLILLLGGADARSSAKSQPRITKEQALTVATAVRDQARQPSWHGRDEVSVLVEIDRWRVVMPLKGGKSHANVVPESVGGICREWAFARTNGLDRSGKETAQGGLSLYKQENVGKKRVWRFKAADEGTGIPESTIRKLKVPQDVVKALGIEVLRGA